MRLKCPHCRAIGEYERKEIRVFVVCRRCGKEFHPAASAPVISGDTVRSAERPFRTGGVFSGTNEPMGQEWANLTRRGMNYFHLRMYEKAEEEFKRSIELNRDQPQVLRVMKRIRAMSQTEA
jgi:hypothetical protein